MVHNLVDRHDLWLISRAVCFRATAFRGSGRYDSREGTSLAEARVHAREMFAGRPVAIYGVTPDGRASFIENVDPKRDTPITEGEVMSIYVMSYRVPNISHPLVYRMPPGADKVRAAAFVGSLPEDQAAIILESVDDTRKMSGPLMVKLYNEFLKQSNKKFDLHGSEARTSVKKFENLTVASNRLFREVIDAANNISEELLVQAEAAGRSDAEPKEEEFPLDKALLSKIDAALDETASNNPEETDMAKKTEKKSRSKIDLKKKIEILVEENPKVKTSKTYKRFALYRNGQTVEAFIKAGGTLADVRWDVKEKFIKLRD